MQDIDKATDGVAYPGGGCHVGEALKAAKSNLFGSKHSDSYRRFLVTVIGGASEDDVFQVCILWAGKYPLFMVQTRAHVWSCELIHCFSFSILTLSAPNMTNAVLLSSSKWYLNIPFKQLGEFCF